MSEKTRPSEDNVNISQARKEVIDSILTSGLKSGRELEKTGTFFVQSTDPIPCSSVFGCQIRNGSDIKVALYYGSESVLPVLAERSYDLAQLGRLRRMSEAESVQYISKRMCSSMMVICGMDDLKGIIGGIAVRGVAVEDMSSIIFPEDIWDEYTKMTHKSVTEFPKVAQVKYAEKYLTAFRRVMKVPDYETVIKARIEQSGGPLWISGVKLPAHGDDLKRL